MSQGSTPPSCGAEIPIPPSHCALPAGHSGIHYTAEIPEPLLGIAAEMLIEQERLRAARARLDGSRRTAAVATYLALIGAAGFLIATMIVVVVPQLTG